MKKIIFILLLISSFSYGQKDVKLLSTERPIIECNVNGIKCNMLIDTGSSINIIDINSLDLFSIKKKHAIVDILSASGKAYIYRLGNFESYIEDYQMTQFIGMDINNVKESIESATGIRVIGILGTPAIKELGMIIDLSRGIITINKNSETTVSTD